MLKKILLAGALFSSVSTLSCDEHGKTGFLPENDMYISTSQKSINGVTEEVFNNVIDRAIEHYESIVASHGANLKVIRNWEDGTVNAYANRQGSTWNVHMFGGLARHQHVTADGFALVVCHELGHHLAGAPKIRRFFSSTWASNEGQSDYWASMKCFRRIYESDNNAEIVSNMEIDATVASKCDKAWDREEDQALCKRVSMASEGLATLLNRDKPVYFDKPATNVVSRTNDKHPAGQCRLDTYFHGALCTKSFLDDVSDRDAKQGVCNRSENLEVGTRRLCWYKPKN